MFTSGVRFVLTLSVCAVALSAQTTRQSATEETKKETVKAETKAAPAKTVAAPASGAGMLVTVDPVTKQIRPPTAEEAAALTRTAPPTNSATTGPITFRGKGNSVIMATDPSSYSYMVVTKTPDGKLKADCVTGDKAAAEQLKGAQATKKAVLDEK